ncbi:MAG: LytR cell envelope-related transcriptional attenuator, partial [Solirubrobacterales bacterium]|nr:LytR cell envelope-related transcriptional attenuator [Solirubrobacterales bacterium]
PATTPAAPGNGTPPPATSVGQETQAIQAVDGGTELPPAVPSVVAPTPIGPEGPPTDDSPVPLRQISGSSVQPRRRAGAEAAAPVTVEPSSNRPRGRTLGMIAGAVAALLLVVVLATQLGGGDDPSPAAGAGTATTSTDNEFVPPPTGPTSPTTPPVEPGDYAVYVLNGTLQNGIAAEVAKTLETDGYRSAGTGNAAVNTATTTEIFYLEGKKRGASAVARKLGVAAANVKAAPREVSVQGPGADVIVQIGADKATP